MVSTTSHMWLLSILYVASMTKEMNFSFYLNLNNHIQGVATTLDLSIQDIIIPSRLIDHTGNLDKNDFVLSPSTLDLHRIWAFICSPLSFSVPPIIVLIKDHCLPCCQSTPESPGLISSFDPWGDLVESRVQPSPRPHHDFVFLLPPVPQSWGLFLVHLSAQFTITKADSVNNF